MKVFSGNSFTELYYRMLEAAVEGYRPESVQGSRVGPVSDLGQTFFSIESDGFRMPLLLKRGFNPFFAFAEFAWFLNGDNTLAPLQKILPDYDQFSDDQKTLNGAYGERLRKHFGFDQIERAIDILKEEPESRRVVLQIWSANDLGLSSKDIPCNTQIMLKIRSNKLDLTVINRSNDLFRGVPYNVFLFFMLQKYIARKLECEVGVQSHFTDTLHIYQDDIQKVIRTLEANSHLDFLRVSEITKRFSWDTFLQDQKLLTFFADIPYPNANEDFFNDVTNIFSFSLPDYKQANALADLASNPLALVNLLWQDAFGKIAPITAIFNGFFMIKNRQYFDGFRRADAERLAEAASVFAVSEKEKIPQIEQVLSNNYITNISNKSALLQAFFLASVLATVDTQVLYTDERAYLLSNFESACVQLGVDYNYLMRLLPFVDSVWDH